MFRKIIHELKVHSPFTLFGALTGVALAVVFTKMPHEISYNLFYVFHPLHVCLSAFVTTAIYRRYLSDESSGIKMFLKVLAVGFVISISTGTLSDSLIPFWGETLLGMPHRHLHIGFVEKWWLVNPLAVIAIIIAYNKPVSKCPHAGHVLVSTWASLLHMLMAIDPGHAISYLGIFVFLFLAVWIPCCLSDIVFPLLLVRDKNGIHQCGHCTTFKK
ncbi:MAG TPA: hypothetical protein PL155_03015 [Candidatus Omnitrophota bacterium]|nr:hypothetical protein [Candidatus Omnitrophota bacterium]HPD84547.1 hypothetical protein [Candidatus Omnitrophota bacterium]HRZ03405.1 hypothetical protein [Candidatus Omnitrophota bacterium]